MKGQLAVREILKEKFVDLKNKNESFSLRAFAQKLEMSSGALSEIMNGTRKVSKKSAEKISLKLNMDPQQRSEFLANFEKELDQFLEENKLEYHLITMDQYKVIADWYHFAILSLMRTSDFQNNYYWISKRLQVPERDIHVAISRMKRLGLINEDENGALTRTQNAIRSPDDIACDSLKQAHSQSMDLAKRKMETVTVKKRDFTTMTMAIDVSKISQAKELIRKFQDQMSELLEVENQTEVYQLAIHFFPVSEDLKKQEVEDEILPFKNS